jgi:hypothetical protein
MVKYLFNYYIKVIYLIAKLLLFICIQVGKNRYLLWFSYENLRISPIGRRTRRAVPAAFFLSQSSPGT